MKKTLQLLAVAALMMAAQGKAMAYDGSVVAPSGQTIYYNFIDSTGSITITYPRRGGWGTYPSPVGALTLPDSVAHNGTMYPVTSVSEYAFEYCDNLTAVTIPQGLVSIGSYAFGRCASLASLVIPDGVTEIGYHAFDGIRHIEYHGSATWPSYDRYWGASSLNGFADGDFLYTDSTMTTLTAYLGTATNVTIPSTVVAIGPGAFSGFQTLSNVVFPEGLVSIGSEAFLDCYYLTTLNFPDSLREIGTKAFADCLNIPNVRIPDSVTSIGNDAFYMIRHLEYYGNATYADDNLYWGAFSLNGVRNGYFLFSDSTYTKLTCYLGNGTHVNIPSTVTTIGQGAFAVCENLTSVNIPDHVTAIDYGAFMYCINLVTITLPASLITIGEDAFQGCEALTSLVIPGGVTSIGTSAFSYCSSLTSIILPDGLTTIDDGTFVECRALPTITIPASVTKIGAMAFCFCSNLRDVYALRDTTPELVGFAFWRIHDSAVVHVPCGSLESYTSEWSSYFDSISEEMMHTLTLLPSDETMGWVEVLTEPDCGQDAVVQATANPGYLFEGWSISTVAGDSVVSANPLTLTLTSDLTLTAHFAPDGVGIGSVADDSVVSITVRDGRLIITGAPTDDVHVIDMVGREVRNEALPTGVYLVIIGSRPAQKVVVW